MRSPAGNTEGEKWEKRVAYGGRESKSQALQARLMQQVQRPPGQEEPVSGEGNAADPGTARLSPGRKWGKRLGKVLGIQGSLRFQRTGWDVWGRGCGECNSDTNGGDGSC